MIVECFIDCYLERREVTELVVDVYRSVSGDQRSRNMSHTREEEEGELVVMRAIGKMKDTEEETGEMATRVAGYGA